MPRFRYKTVDKDGKPHSGEASAKTSDAIITELRNHGLTVLEIKEVADEKEKHAAEAAAKSKQITFSFGGISLKDLSLFTRQLATTLNAGIPLMRIVHVLRKRNASPSMKKVLDQIASDLQQGLSFSQSLGKHPAIFDETYLNMCRVGEASGNLPETITRLALMLEKDVAVRRKISGAMAYPMFILIFTAILSYAMVAFLMPLFMPMLTESGLDIKNQYPLTHLLMEASKIASNPVNMGLLVLFLVLAFVGFKVAVRFPTGRYAVDLVKFYFPFLHPLIQQGVTARFARGFALLLQSGVPLLQALQLISQAAGNKVVQRALDKVAKNISEGDKLSETLDRCKIFPDLMIQMASIGEEAGSLPEMFEHVAEYYEAEIDATITALTSVLEPAMMIIVGGIVGLFIMGVLLPIMGISQAVQSGMK